MLLVLTVAFHVVPQLNFGLDLRGLACPREQLSVNDRPVNKTEARRLLESGGGLDDGDRLRLTIIGSEAERSAVRRDLEGPLADLAGEFLIQDYPPDHWVVARAGFFALGRPTIYVQEPSGKVRHRQDDYADGPAGLRQALAAIRKPDPGYDPTRDPDLRTPSAAGRTLLPGAIVGSIGCVAVMLLVELARRRAVSPLP